MDSQTSLKTSQREGCNPLNPPPGSASVLRKRTSPGNCICCQTRARWSIDGQGQSIYSPLILRVWPNLKKYHFVNHDLVLVFFLSALLFIDHDMCFKLKSWNAIEKTISVKHYFLFFCLVLFYYSSYCFYYLLFLLFLGGVLFGNGNESNFALNFIWTQMNIQLVCFFITFSTKKENMATEYLNVRVVLRLVLGKDHPSCQPLLQLEKIMAFTMVREGIRFTQGKELGQLRCRVKTRGSLSKKSF